MKIELKNKHNKHLRKIAEILETQPVLYFETDDSPESYALKKALEQEDGYSCLKVFSEVGFVYWVINTDFPHIKHDIFVDKKA